jgi:hypothetical protein
MAVLESRREVSLGAGETRRGLDIPLEGRPGTIKSTIQQVDPPSRIAWTGTTFGIKAVHVYVLEPRGAKTLVRTTETYDGLVARLFRKQLRKTLDRALVEGLQHLKAELERRPSEPTG